MPGKDHQSQQKAKAWHSLRQHSLCVGQTITADQAHGTIQSTAKDLSLPLYISSGYEVVSAGTPLVNYRFSVFTSPGQPVDESLMNLCILLALTTDYDDSMQGTRPCMHFPQACMQHAQLALSRPLQLIASRLYDSLLDQPLSLLISHALRQHNSKPLVSKRTKSYSMDCSKLTLEKKHQHHRCEQKFFRSRPNYW